MKKTRISRILPLGLLLAFGFGWAQANDWPQLQNGPERHGYSSENIQLPLSNVWAIGFAASYATRPPESISPAVQPIIMGGKVFLGSEMGTFYSIDALTGNILHTYKAGGPILHTAASTGTLVFFGCMDGKVYALNQSDLSVAWIFDSQKRGGFSTAILLAEGKVFMGSRAGIYYALDQFTGAKVWETTIGAPIMMSSAYDVGTDGVGRIFFAAQNMRAYALAASNGQILWQTSPIGGTSFKDYWPLCYMGKVLLRPAPIWYEGNGADLSTWAPGPLPQSDIDAQINYINFLNTSSTPNTPNLHCFDQITMAETMVSHWTIVDINGAPMPPAVDGDGMLIVPTRVNGWMGAWSRMDLTKGYSTELLCDAAQPTAGRGNKDESMCVSAAGRLVFVIHTMEANAQYSGVWNLDQHTWMQITPYTADQGLYWNGTESYGTSPMAISNGYIYHVTENTLNCRKGS